MRKMIKLTISLSLLAVVFSGFGVSHASDGINLQVRVLERKSTDTINDFNFNGAIPEPRVLGSSTDRTKMCSKGEIIVPEPNFWQKLSKYLILSAQR